MISGWSRALDTLDAQLDLVELALERDGDADLGVLVGAVPEGLGVLPVDLRTRAAAVHARLHEVELVLQCELEHTRQLLALGGTASEGPSRPLLFDQRG